MKRHLAWLAAAILFLAIPIAEGADFQRGDSNQDGSLNIADTIHLLSYLIFDIDMPCLDAADVNDDGAINIGDPVYSVYFFFSAVGPASIPAPSFACGADPTADALDCLEFPLCP